MWIYTVCILSMIITVHGVTEDGFTSRCDSNNTLFVKKGEVASFQTDTKTYIHVYHLSFDKGIIGNQSTKLLMISFYRNVEPHERYIEDGFNFTILDNKDVIITLQDVAIEDNGMYFSSQVSWTTFIKCWELFVIDIWSIQDVQTFEEYRPAFIHATPPASHLVRPRVNATATWLFNGLNYSETTDFQEQDGYIMIVSTERRMTNTTVTYRIAEDEGVIHEVNLTISVTYGPDPFLKFSPAKTFYTLTTGELLPDITCTTDCNPTCQIRWDISGAGDVLRLGQVDLSSSGMYTCIATRNGSDDVVERSIYVEITEQDVDHTLFIIGLAVLGTTQVVTMICLAVCAVCKYRKSRRNGGNRSRVQTGGSNSVRDNRTSQHVYEQSIPTVELSHYEGIDNTQANAAESYVNLN